MASREEPQVDDTRGLPDVPAPQETLFEEPEEEQAEPEATAAPERNGDAPGAQGATVSPGRPRGMASFAGGPPPVSTPPPTQPLFTQTEITPPATPSFQVITVESTAAFRPAGPPPPAPALTEAPAALAAEPEDEVEDGDEETTARSEPTTAPQATAAPETAVPEPAAEAEPEPEPRAPKPRPARRSRSGRAARERAEAAAAETTTTGASGPEAAAAEEPVAESTAETPVAASEAPGAVTDQPASATTEAQAAAAPSDAPDATAATEAPEAAEAAASEAPSGRSGTRSRRRRSRSGRAAAAQAQADAESEPITEGEAATQPETSAPSAAIAGQPPSGEAGTTSAAIATAAGNAPLTPGTAEATGDAADDADEPAGSARTRARRRRRAAAKARLRGSSPVDTDDQASDAGTGQGSAPAATQPASRQPAPAAPERPAVPERPAAPVRPQAPQGRGNARQQAAADAAPEAPAADAAPAAPAGDEAPPSRGRGRGRRRVGSRSQTEQADGTATEQAPARTPAPAERSTRLEAARTRGARQGQGPDRSRRRRGGLTEDQKRVLREGPERRMLVTEGAERTQIGVIEGRTLVEHYVTRKAGRSMVGNIYLGRVQNVLPGMEAAFVDIGKGRNAVLYAGEVNYNEEDLDGEAPRIEKALKPGQAILVQVTKDPIGAKGARLTTQVSLAGRYLVLQPEDSTFGISRRLPEGERIRLREILKEVRPKGLGLIVRTAADGATADDLRADLTRLQARWETIERKARKASPPAVIYQEPELVVRVIRDIFSPDFVELVVDAPGLFQRVQSYLEEVAPDLLPKVRAHDGQLALFEQYRVTEQIHKALERKVWLPSGGSLVIDQTEAMTVVDVNTGKYVGKSNLEETVVATNLEAAEEIVRQLRLRDIGGIIIIDFIDMLFEKNQQAVVERLRSALARDKTKSQVMEVSSLGLVQMTRKRVSGGLLDSFSETCPACEGRGVVITHEV
jgi:ribonuclease E